MSTPFNEQSPDNAPTLRRTISGRRTQIVPEGREREPQDQAHQSYKRLARKQVERIERSMGCKQRAVDREHVTANVH